MVTLSNSRDPQVARWLEQARDERIQAAIASIYHEVSVAIERERPHCLASGHCCHFDAFGHDLFVTAIETAWFITSQEDDLEEDSSRHSLPLLTTTEDHERTPPAASDRAPVRVCPWLDGRLCGARAVRPLGCRTYFCDPRAAAWSEPLHESMHGRLRQLHERFDIAYRYDEWLRMLSFFGADPRHGTRA